MKFFSRSLLVVIAAIFLFGCAAQQKFVLPPFSPFDFDTSKYASRVDNFEILFDASRSLEMDGTFEEAKAVVDRMNQTIPEMGQNAGLRSFGHDPSVSSKQTELFYGMTRYSTAGLAKSFAKINKAGGFSPVNDGLDAAGQDLKGSKGQITMVIVSDGKDFPGDVLAAAKNLKKMYGARICFYTIHVGNSVKGRALMDKIAEIGGCGFSISAREVLTSGGMAQFVEKAFLMKQAGDADGDGVLDVKDKCPGTPKGARVNRAGCWVLSNILFDYNKAQLRAVYQPALFSVVTVMEQNPGMKVELQGHTDNRGTAAYNMGLSKRRAEAAKAYLVEEGISAARIQTKGFGFSKPVATNDTDKGRALNRRVEIHPMK